ncbi:alpha/beta fold hydrolase [Pyxidicoccus sp. 3LG]
MTTSTTQRLRSFVTGQLDLPRAVARVLKARPFNPYPYLKPLIEKASGVREPPISATPHTVVYTRGSMRLLRYASPRRRYRTPILFVYSLINRWYILDFLPGRSLIEHLTKEGYDVYAIDWGVPGQSEERIDWAELLGGLIQTAVQWTLRVSKSRELTLYGYCMGGTMALAYTSLYPEGVRNLVAQATPVDFSQGGVYTLWTAADHFDVDSLVDATQRAHQGAGERLPHGRARAACDAVAGGVPPHRRPGLRHHLPRHGALGRGPRALPRRGVSPVHQGLLPAEPLPEGPDEGR